MDNELKNQVISLFYNGVGVVNIARQLRISWKEVANILEDARIYYWQEEPQHSHVARKKNWYRLAK